MLKYETHDNEIVAGFVADNEVDRKKSWLLESIYAGRVKWRGVYIFKNTWLKQNKHSIRGIDIQQKWNCQKYLAEAELAEIFGWSRTGIDIWLKWNWQRYLAEAELAEMFGRGGPLIFG